MTRLIATMILLLALRPSWAALPTDVFSWPVGVATNGPYTLVSVVSNYIVLSPNGTAPTETDIATHRYHHHTRIFWTNHVIYIAFSSCGVGEGDAGMQVVVAVSSDRGITWTAPVIACQSQSEWTTNHNVTGSRMAFPRCWSTWAGTNYIISGVDIYSDTSHTLSEALMATPVFSDGSVGTMVRISTNAYSVLDGKPEVPTNFVLRPKLMQDAKLFGCWGGGTDAPQKEWQNYTFDGTYSYHEPNTFPVDETGTNFFRLWRPYSGALKPNYVYQNSTTNTGTNFSIAVQTTIPNNPSETTGLRLSNGQYVIIGNPSDYGTNNRDPLYLAITASDDTAITNVYAIVQGIDKLPIYPGFSKLGGAAYPDVCQMGNYLYVSYSIHKESIGFSRVLIPGLEDNNNDGPSIPFSHLRSENLRVTGSIQGR